MNAKRIVIIAGTIHPHISARSFRATELACGLAKLGYDITIYAQLGTYDYSSFEHKTNVHVKQLGKSYCGNVNSDGEVHLNVFNRALRRLFYNIIDYPRCEYFFKTLSVLKQETDFDYLITIAHPYGIHWGAAYYKRYINNGKFQSWISDCGDPFMGDPDVPRWSLFQRPIEKFWGRLTDYISIPVENGKKGYYEEVQDKIRIIPQSIDFSTIEIEDYKPHQIPTFLYSGAVYPGMRDPTAFLQFLSTFSHDFRFIVYAPSPKIFEDFQPQLRERLEVRPYISRRELIKVMSTMDFLINFSNNSDVQTPSKLIDYSLSKRPILNISTSLTEAERNGFREFLNLDYSHQYIVPDVDQYDSINVAKKFIKILSGHE